MFKNLITPIQLWLMSQGRCVACGQDLSKMAKTDIRGKTTITCKCGRMFIFDPAIGTYRRALFDEV